MGKASDVVLPFQELEDEDRFKENEEMWVAHQVEPITWRELSRHFYWAFISLAICIGHIAFLTLIPMEEPRPFKIDYGFIFGFDLLINSNATLLFLGWLLTWFPEVKWYKPSVLLSTTLFYPSILIGIKILLTRYSIPFNMMIGTATAFPAIVAVLFIIFGNSIFNDPKIRSRLKEFFYFSGLFPFFFIVGCGYIILFGLTKIALVQILINILFGIIKYVIKRAAYRKYYKFCGPIVANYVNLLMETINQVFNCIIFLGHANRATIVVNLVIECLIYIRSAMGATFNYQLSKRKMISWLRLDEIDRFLSNTMFPTSDLSIEQQRHLQTGWLCMTLSANILTLVGGILSVYFPRISSTNSSFFPFSDKSLQNTRLLFRLDPFPSAIIIIAGTQGVLIILSIFLLNLIKWKYQMQTVNSAFRFFSEYRFLAIIGTVGPFTFLLSYILKHVRTFSFVFPEDYN